MNTQLKSIDEEAQACREAFVGIPVGTFALHCHHRILGETLTTAAESRVDYILTDKPYDEQPQRLRLFRPVTDKELKEMGQKDLRIEKANTDRKKAFALGKAAFITWADKALAALVHPLVCKGCPWDGTSIFPGGRL